MPLVPREAWSISPDAKFGRRLAFRRFTSTFDDEMATPRQRRKNRSGSHSAVKQSRRAKKNLRKHPAIKGPKALQDAWDKKKTVRQNYEAMGLVHSLNPIAQGGTEKALLASDWVKIGKAAPKEESAPPGLGISQKKKGKGVVSALEKLSASGVKTQRHASMHEIVWLKELVAVHGTDIGAMAHDLKRNVWQKTPGELKRAINKAGGFEKLKSA
ncbi:Nucleolar protein 16 [Ceratobasidium sp. 423]|nr:Nucleolar protein 16 [Ceratobasidium sp. 423]